MDGVISIVVGAVSLMNQEAAGIERVLSKSGSEQPVNSFQEPSSWGIYLPVTGLQQKHAGVFISSQQLKAFCWKFDPELPALRTALKEGSGDISCPG